MFKTEGLVSLDVRLTYRGREILNRMTATASVLKRDPNTKRFKLTFILTQTHSMQIWGGKFPLSSHKTAPTYLGTK